MRPGGQAIIIRFLGIFSVFLPGNPYLSWF
jgi:hypothetical protein